MSGRRIFIAVVVFAALAPVVRAQGRTELTVNATGFQAENLTSSQNGSVYFGSRAKGCVRNTTFVRRCGRMSRPRLTGLVVDATGSPGSSPAGRAKARR